MSPTGSPQFLSDRPDLNSESESKDDLDFLLRTNIEFSDDGYSEFVIRRRLWWDSARVREWLLKESYKLYEHRSHSMGFPSDVVHPTNVVRQQSEFPFAYHDPPSRPDESAYPPFMANTGARGIIGYAQDASGRHVAIKAILRNSKEKEILEYLRVECFPKSIDEFQNVLPVLDILAYEGHWLAIMPRWGDEPLTPSCLTMKEVFHFIRCLLNGLSFLHEHRIVHGDIRLENILVNHTESCRRDLVNDRRMSLRTEGKLTYALFDFSHATMFPRSAPIETCRLPSQLSFVTWPELRPFDTLQGELDFNPFAFDVGVLGVLFCGEFQHLIPVAPMLAPLLDKMTSQDIPRRFTAAEALLFLDQHVDPRTDSQGAHIVGIRPAMYPKWHGTYDRWEGLLPDFVREWGAYREPPTPWHVQLLRDFCRRPWGARLVRSVRRFCRGVWYFPQRLIGFSNSSAC